MKRKTTLLIAAALACTLLTGCCMSHQWQEATCETPKTCAKCGKTGGEALGHDWREASCEAPETCARCGETRGEALGHSWVEATCEEAKHCSVCGAEEGEPLGHMTESGRIFGRVEPDDTRGTYVSLNHAGICIVCGSEFEETVGDQFNFLARGSWTAVDETGLPEALLELRGDGTALMIYDGAPYYGTWSGSGFGQSPESDPLEKEGDEAPITLYTNIEFQTEGKLGSVAFGKIDATNSMEVSITNINYEVHEFQFHRGISDADRKIMDDVIAKKALVEETLCGKWELRMISLNDEYYDQRESDNPSYIEIRQDGKIAGNLGADTFKGLWLYEGEKTDTESEMYQLHMRFDYENGGSEDAAMTLWFSEEPMEDGLIGAEPVLILPSAPYLAWYVKSGE